MTAGEGKEWYRQGFGVDSNVRRRGHLAGAHTAVVL